MEETRARIDMEELMTTEVKEKGKRAPRRNYQVELSMLHLYCEANISALEFLKVNLGPTMPTDAIEGQIIAYRNVLSRLNGAK